MTRRRVLELLAAAATLPAAARHSSAVGAEVDGGTGLVPVGRAYLEQYPGEADRAFLCRCLADSLAGSAGLRAVIEQEFEAGMIVSVRGFVLSRTEARLAAHAALAARATDRP